MITTLIVSIFLFGSDFPICTAPDVQDYPCAVFAHDQYYAFWVDDRQFATEGKHAIYGARVAQNGTVIDPDGKLLFKNQVGYATAAAFDGTNCLVVFRDSC